MIDVGDNGRLSIKRSVNLGPDELDIANLHAFDYPMYICDHQFQTTGPGPPKRDPRAHLGVYLDHSSIHDGIVALVMNTRSGRVSSQYHVIFDDELVTVLNLRYDITLPEWKELWRSCKEHTS